MGIVQNADKNRIIKAINPVRLNTVYKIIMTAFSSLLAQNSNSYIKTLSS